MQVLSNLTEAGYNINRRTFFKYIIYILIFSVLGTIVAFSIIAPLTYLANSAGLFHITFMSEAQMMRYKMQSSNITYHNTTNTTYNTLPNNTQKTHHDSRYLLSSVEEEINENNYTLLDKNIYNRVFNPRYLNLENNEKNSSSSELKNKTADTKAEDEISYQLNFSIHVILLFSAVISATDTVAALIFISEQNEQKLYSILFGEGVINDAVCIVLYRIIRDFTKSGDGNTSQLIY